MTPASFRHLLLTALLLAFVTSCVSGSPAASTENSVDLSKHGQPSGMSARAKELLYQELHVGTTLTSEPALPVSITSTNGTSRLCFVDADAKYRELGRFYRQKYVSDLVFDAVVDVEKIKSSQYLLGSLKTAGVVSQIQRSSNVNKVYDKFDGSETIAVTFSPHSLEIRDAERFYESIITDEYLSYFSLKKKVGSWWAYVDLSNIMTWEVYFWLAYFTENGFEPEYSAELNALVVGNFVSAEEALHLKEQLTDLPIEVAFVVYQKYATAAQPTIQVLDASAVPTDFFLELSEDRVRAEPVLEPLKK